MKAIVKLFAAVAQKDDAAKNAMATDLKMSRDDFDMFLDGTLEISAAQAMKLEQVTGIDAHDILSAQAADQLATLGKARIKKVDVPEVNVAEKAAPKAKKTSSDGAPRQSPMTRGPRPTGAIAVKL